MKYLKYFETFFETGYENFKYKIGDYVRIYNEAIIFGELMQLRNTIYKK